MPKSTHDFPQPIRSYLNLGIELDYRKGEGEAISDCPFCGKENKFSVNVETGQCKCWSCDMNTEKGGGNSKVFAEKYLEVCYENTKDEDYKSLSQDRGIQVETFYRWEVCQSINGQWLLPTSNEEGKFATVYRYEIGGSPMAIFGLGSGLYYPKPIPGSVEALYLCEGPWDAMRLSEVLDPTTEAAIGIPGAGSFQDKWVASKIFLDRELIFCFDSDKPGYKGIRRSVNLFLSNPLCSGEQIDPEDVYYLKWGEEGIDSSLPDGYDVRDALHTPSDAPDSRPTSLEELRRRIVQIPIEWITEQKNSEKKSENLSLEPLKCETYEQLVTAWKAAMEWTPGLDCALSVMLATALSTQQRGEQLWIKIISPPGSGKTTLVEGLSVCKKYTFSKDTIRGFFSGWISADKSKGEGKKAQNQKTEEKDTSVAALANRKTLIIKDGDTLLKSPDLPRVLSEGRGLYDGTARTIYRNAVSHEYEGHRMTFLLCGTSALREIDESELGSRFLDCVIMDGIDEEFEMSVNLKAARREMEDMRALSNGVPTERHSPELTRAMQLTGGYVQYLREHSTKLVDAMVIDDRFYHRVSLLGTFVSRLRARPNKDHPEEVNREFSPRLTKQLLRLGIGIAVVMNKTSLDKLVLGRITKIARDTSRGSTLKMLKFIHEEGRDGATKDCIRYGTEMGRNSCYYLLGFLRGLEVLETQQRERGPILYRMRDSMWKIYEEVMGNRNY